MSVCKLVIVRVIIKLFFLNLFLFACTIQHVWSRNNKSNKKKISNNKIVYLISSPRSLSTAFLRMMEMRGDFEVMQEPSFSPLHKNKKNFFKNEILQKSYNKNLFIKEISFGVKDFILSKAAFQLVQNQQVYFLFLMRNPHHVVISRYKSDSVMINLGQEKNLEADVFSYKTGYKDLYEIFTYIKHYAVNKPCIILSEHLYTNPEFMSKAVSDFLDIPYKKEALTWNSLGESYVGENWHNIKKKEVMLAWHKNLLNSTGFFVPTEYKIGVNGEPTFEEIPLEHKEMCIDAYAENLVFYNKLLQESEFFLKK